MPNAHLIVVVLLKPLQVLQNEGEAILFPLEPLVGQLYGLGGLLDFLLLRTHHLGDEVVMLQRQNPEAETLAGDGPLADSLRSEVRLLRELLQLLDELVVQGRLVELPQSLDEIRICWIRINLFKPLAEDPLCFTTKR